MLSLTLLLEAESFVSSGLGNSGQDGKAEKSMALLTLMIAAQLKLFGSVARESKYVNPCEKSIELFSMDNFERIVVLHKKSEKCNREAQVRKLVNATVDLVESTWGKQRD